MELILLDINKKSRREPNHDFSWVHAAQKSVDTPCLGVIVTYNTEHPEQDVHHEPQAPQLYARLLRHRPRAGVRADRSLSCVARPGRLHAGRAGSIPSSDAHTYELQSPM